MFLTQDLVRSAVKDHAEWQAHRASMKGESTGQKLRMLEDWMSQRRLVSGQEWQLAEIQVQNYLNALARGGQIEPTNKRMPVLQQVREAVIRR